MSFDDFRLTVISKATGATIHSLYEYINLIGVCLYVPNIKYKYSDIDNYFREINKLTGGTFSLSDIDL